MPLEGARAAAFLRQPDLPADTGPTIAAAWIDTESDGRQELLVATSSPNQVGSLCFYRRSLDGTFTKHSTNFIPGIDTATAPFSSLIVADLNNDGAQDVVATAGSSARPDYTRYFVNHTDGTFQAVAAGGLNRRPDAVRVAPAFDANGDGLLDLILFPTDPNSPDHMVSQINQGDGTLKAEFANPFEPSITSASEVVPVDFDLDGIIDLYVLNAWDGNRRRDLLMRGDGTGHFSEVRNTPFETAAVATRFVAFGDFANQGGMDAVVVREGQAPRLYLSHGGAYDAEPLILDAPAGKPVALDYDNDGFLDLLVVGDGTPAGRGAVLLRNLGGAAFERVVDAFDGMPGAWKDAVVADYDGDAALDLYLVSDEGPGALYRNAGTTNQWIRLTFAGTGSDSYCVGRTIRTRASITGKIVVQVRQMGLSGKDETSVLIGLGDAATAEEVFVPFPSHQDVIIPALPSKSSRKITEKTGVTPVRPAAALNSSITLTSRFSGTGYSHNWYFRSRHLEGQTNSTLTLTNLSLADDGPYTYVMQRAGVTYTNTVYLHVNPQFSRVLTGAIAESANTYCWVPFDLDNDGSLEFMTRRILNLTSLPAIFYRNLGDTNFVEMPENRVTKIWGGANGPAVADYDNDGYVDYYEPRFGQSVFDLFHNSGNGTFQAITNQPFSKGVNEDAWAMFSDLNRDGLLDLVIGGGYDGAAQSIKIYRNTAGGGFTRLAKAQVGNVATTVERFNGGQVLDYDMDGNPDIIGGATYRIVAFHNDGAGALNSATIKGLTDQPADMFISWADYDNDGFPDILVGPSNWSDGKAVLYHNEAGKAFTKVNAPWSLANLAAPSRPFWGNGIWGDYDNDGHIDCLLLLAGWTSQLLHNRGDGRFEMINFELPGRSQEQGVFVDYDNNGTLDLVLGGGGFPYNERWDAPTTMLRNVGNGNHYLKFKLRGTTSNRDGVGAKVWVSANINRRAMTQYREIVSDAWSGYTPLQAHFGLGDATNAVSVRVSWPSGIIQELGNVAADQFLTVTEPLPWKLSASLDQGVPQFRCQGPPNAAAILESSVDLVTWTREQAVATDASGSALLDAVARPAERGRFFRVR